MIHARGRLLGLLALLAALALLLVACADDAAEPEEEDTDDEAVEEADDADDDDADDDEVVGLTLATGSTGGTYFPLGGAMAEAWNDELSVAVSTQATGASVENLRLLAGEEVELIMAVNGVAHDAYDGIGEFDGEPIEVEALGNVYPEVLQVIARADADINSIADLEGKRVAIGPPGSGTEVVARRLLGFAGIDPDNDIDAFSETFGDATDQLQDGQVDAAFAILALPAGSVEEVATNTDIVVVNIDGDIQAQLLAEDDSYSAIDVPAGTYSSQAEDSVTVANWATLYALAGMDEDLAYGLTSVLYESAGRIADTIAVGEQIVIETAIDGLGPIPLNTGSARFFEEQGLMVD